MVPGRGGGRATRELAEEASEKLVRKTPVVIGENMKERVIPFARQKGYLTIDDFVPKSAWGAAQHTGGEEAMKALNRRWIRQMIREGRPIIDIGPDPRRKMRSDFYLLELEEIRRANYPHQRNPMP